MSANNIDLSEMVHDDVVETILRLSKGPLVLDILRPGKPLL